jgi:hypothetical protein
VTDSHTNEIVRGVNFAERVEQGFSKSRAGHFSAMTVTTTNTRPTEAAVSDPDSDGVVEQLEANRSEHQRRRNRLLLIALAVLAMAMLVVALIVSSSYNPTPTNVNSGGPGSGYPSSHHASNYQRPINGDGSQSS